MESIEGICKAIIFESQTSTYKVIKCLIKNNEEILVGNFPIMELEGRYRFEGKYVSNEKYGDQFQVESYNVLAHDSKSGLVDYLASDKFKGIGKSTATKIVDALGLDAIDKIKQDPNCLAGIKISKALRDSLKDELIKSEEQEATYIKLYSFGLTQNMAKRVYDLYLDDSVKKIEENPYILIKDLQGFGFYKCDLLAKNIGFSLHSPLRLKEAMIFTLNEACIQYGFTYVTKYQLVASTMTLLNKKETDKIKEEEITVILNDLLVSNRLVSINERFYPKYLYDAEKNTRERLIQIKNFKLDLPSKDDALKWIAICEEKLGFNLLSLQRDAVLKSVTSKVSIITGGPGTGKTTIIKALLMTEAFLRKLNPEDKEFRNKVLLLSPTGKASKRLAQSALMEAQTIHHALGYSADGSFLKTKLDTLNEELIIVDEASMIDINLMSHLVDALKDNVKLILVGDVNQLPSVGPGNVLSEMISSNLFQTTTLKEIMRQKGDSNIIKLSQMILNKNLDFKLFNEHKEVFFYQAEGQTVLKNIEDLLKLYQKKGGNFVKDIQILAPMYSGVCGIDKINEMIQEKFNPSTNMIVDNGRVFKENDKVLMLQNDPTLGIMNGDDGIIVSIEHLEKKDYIHINFGEKIVRIEGKDLDKITLGYAISIHKSQGSEYKNVILPIVPSFQIMLKPNLIYTAVTRAKGKLIILGNSQTLINSLYQKNDVRQTSLFQNEELKKKVIYINDPSIPFDTLGEQNMENISPYDFM